MLAIAAWYYIFLNHNKETNMSKFGYMQQGAVKPSITKEYEIEEIQVNGVSPVLIVKPANESNAKYINAMLASQTGNRKNKKINAARLKEVLDMDRELYPLYVIDGWKNVVDEKGTEVQFSVEDCNDMVSQLPYHAFSRLRDFCSDIYTWAKDVDIDIEVAIKK